MTEGKVKRVKLRSSLEGASSSAEIKDDGTLVVEFFDYSKEAEDHFGNDVAYQLIIPIMEKEKILSKLIDETPKIKKKKDYDAELLQLIEEKFASYFDVKEWLDANGIRYQKVFDAWA